MPSWELRSYSFLAPCTHKKTGILNLVVTPPSYSQLSKAEAFHTYVEPEIPILFRVARSLTGSTVDAEDLVQDTLIRAFGAMLRFDGENPRAWLLTILRNGWHNNWRKRKPDYIGDWSLVGANNPAFNAEPPRSAEEEVLRGIRDSSFLAAVNSLSEDFRAVLLLVDIEEFTYAECAQILGIPIGTVMSRRSRARTNVRKFLIKSADVEKNK